MALDQTQLDTLSQIQSQVTMINSQISQVQNLANTAAGNKGRIFSLLTSAQSSLNSVNQEISSTIARARFL